MFGSLIIGLPLQHFGRKKSLIGITIPCTVGFLLIGLTYYGRGKVQLYIGRILTGMAVGGMVPASQLYVIRCTSNDFISIRCINILNYIFRYQNALHRVSVAVRVHWRLLF